MRRTMLKLVMVGFMIQSIVQASMLAMCHGVAVRLMMRQFTVVCSMLQLLHVSSMVLLSNMVPAVRAAAQEHGEVRCLGRRRRVKDGQRTNYGKT